MTCGNDALNQVSAGQGHSSTSMLNVEHTRGPLMQGMEYFRSEHHTPRKFGRGKYALVGNQCVNRCAIDWALTRALETGTRDPQERLTTAEWAPETPPYP